ncbi:MAG: hypothetical protein U0572_13670 [Phycisphaerales bacterium]
MNPRVTLAAMILSVGSLLTTPLEGATTRIAVIVLTEEGEPLQGLLVSAVVEGRPIADGATNADGTAKLSFESPAGVSSVEIRHGFARESSFSATEQIRLSESTERLKRSYHLDPAHRIELSPDKNEYELRVTAWPSVSVSARCVDAEHMPLSAWRLHGPPHSAFGYAERGAVIPLRGVRKGQPCVVAATGRVNGYSVVKSMALDAKQTLADVDLGDVVLASPAGGVPIAPEVGGDKAARSIPGYWPGVTFVANDGKFISTFQAGKGMSTPPSDGVIALQSSKEWAPKLPPGEYFVVPGYFVYNADQAIVLQMLSKEIDLSKSDIPRVIVREFDANTFAIDLAKAHEAIQRAAASNGISP